MGSTWLLLDIRGRYGVSVAVTGCGWPLSGLRGCYGLYIPLFSTRSPCVSLSGQSYV